MTDDVLVVVVVFVVVEVAKATKKRGAIPLAAANPGSSMMGTTTSLGERMDSTSFSIAT